MTENCNTYRLEEVVELYCLHQYNDKKKNFTKLLPMAKLVWEGIFQNTIWSNTAEWMPLKAGVPYPYIEVPRGISRLFGVITLDECGNNILLPHNNQINTLPKPANKSCGCKEACSCGGLCSGMNALTYEERDVVLRTGALGGFPLPLPIDLNYRAPFEEVTYKEKIWLQVCGNGEVLKWRKTPIVKYEDNGTSSIVFEEFQEHLCTLEVAPCGCVKETDLNKELITSKCGCAAVVCTSQLYDRHDYHGLEQSQVSECGTKIYIIGAKAAEYKVFFQRKSAAMNSAVPHYCLDLMFSGMYVRSVKWNPTKTKAEKEAAKDEYNDDNRKVIQFLNPIRLEGLARLEGERKPW